MPYVPRVPEEELGSFNIKMAIQTLMPAQTVQNK